MLVISVRPVPTFCCDLFLLFCYFFVFFFFFFFFQAEDGIRDADVTGVQTCALPILPVFLYSATPYYISAYHSIRTKSYNIDIPMALGIIVMFVRSMVDIFIQDGAGFLDSMCGLVFFMLSGKLIQQTTYNFLSFERDYKSYFPIAVTKDRKSVV